MAKTTKRTGEASPTKEKKQKNAETSKVVTHKPQIYHRAWAASTRVVHLIHELGLEDEIEINIVKNYPADLKTPEYKAMHPFGKIPVYKDGDFLLFESGAIFLYLLDKYSEKAAELKLITPTIRPLLYQFLFIGTTELYHWNGVLYEHSIASDADKPALAAKIETYKQKMKDEIVPYLEKTLDGKSFLCGEDFTAVDAAVFYDLLGLKFFGLECGKVVGEYLDRIQARASYKKSFE